MVIALIATSCWALNTEAGFILRTVGANPIVLTTLGKSRNAIKVMGLVLANALNALTGSLFVQYVGYFSIWSNVGILIMALASLMLGEALTKKQGLNALLGSIIYQAIIALTFELNLDQDWNKLVTALLIIALLALQRRKSC
jgi:putative ABC transport system permease protein